MPKKIYDPENIYLTIVLEESSKYLPELSALIIEYLDEEYVKQILLNAHIIFEKFGNNDDTNDCEFEDTNNCNYKSFFMAVLLEPLKNSDFSHLKQRLIDHLKIMIACILSYKLGSNAKTKQITNNFIGLTPDEIPKILKLVIDGYAKYKFYYFYTRDEIIKLRFQETPTEIRLITNVYKLEHNKTKSFIVDSDTGLKIKLHKRLTQAPIDFAELKVKLAKKSKKEQKKYLNEYFNSLPIQNVSYFTTLNDNIYQALSYDGEEYCLWCNPIKNVLSYNQNPEKEVNYVADFIDDFNSTEHGNKCEKCNRLQKELKYLQNKSSNNELKKIDFSNEIQKVKYNKTIISLADLRVARQHKIIDIIKPFGNSSNKVTIEFIKELCKKSFNTEIDLQKKF